MVKLPHLKSNFKSSTAVRKPIAVSGDQALKQDNEIFCDILEQLNVTFTLVVVSGASPARVRRRDHAYPLALALNITVPPEQGQYAMCACMRTSCKYTER